jgi:hypothetical protein
MIFRVIPMRVSIDRRPDAAEGPQEDRRGERGLVVVTGTTVAARARRSPRWWTRSIPAARRTS